MWQTFFPLCLSAVLIEKLPCFAVRTFLLGGGGGGGLILSTPSQQTIPRPLTLKRLGVGLKGPPRHFARLLCNAQSSRRDTLWLFSFKFPAHFDTEFVTPGDTVLKLRNFLYMHVGPKMAPKCDFVYKINANWVFSHSSYKYAYFLLSMAEMNLF